MNNVAMNREVQRPPQLSIFISFGYLEVELLDHEAIFLETSILFYIMAILIYVPITARVPFIEEKDFSNKQPT
jgi:hypothetical protein